MSKCDNDQSCGSVECGPDQSLPDGTILKGQCSWWKTGVCETAAEFSINPHNYILTCKKLGKFLIPCKPNFLVDPLIYCH